MKKKINSPELRACRQGLDLTLPHGQGVLGAHDV